MSSIRLEAVGEDEDLRDEIAQAIAAERRWGDFEAVRSLWRAGDLARTLRLSTSGKWRQAIRHCAKRVGVHPGFIDEAVRAAEAFSPKERELLLQRFERARTSLTPSHVLVLARVAPRQRRAGVDLLLRGRISVRKLRDAIRRSIL